MWLITASSRVFSAVLALLTKLLSLPLLLTADFFLTIGNLLLPRKKHGHVSSLQSQPLWPAFHAPRDGDARSPCVALNTLANHGIIPRSGRGITFPDLEKAIRLTFNTSPTFARLTTQSAADLLLRDFKRDTLDLSDLCCHNGLEHDASITRHDAAFQPDQTKTAQDLVDYVLDSATGKDSQGHARLTVGDMIKISTKRRADSRARNSQYTQSAFHKFLASSNKAVLTDIFGGSIDTLRVLLREERLPEGWEPSDRSRFGITIASLNVTILAIELGTKEERGPRRIKLAGAEETIV